MSDHTTEKDSDPLLKNEYGVDRLRNSTASIDRCLRTVSETHDIGANTLVMLNDQKDTIIRIQGKLDNSINPNINKSNSVVTSMFKRLRNNKCITYATVLVCIAIILMLLVLIFTKK